MGFFGKSKPSHSQSLEDLINLTIDIFRFAADSKGGIRFLSPHSRFKLLFFSLCTAHVGRAPNMKNPDAVLNDAMAQLVQFTFADQVLPGDSHVAKAQYGGPQVPQEAANLAGKCVGDFLHRFSSWLDIYGSGNRPSATGIVAGMLREIETTNPPSQEDTTRLHALAAGIEAMIVKMRT